MERTYDTCIIVASELNSRLNIGHFWKLFFILFALVSRITVLIKFNTKFLCELYGKLLPHCNKMQIVGSNWLPEDYILPTDLTSWLGVPWVSIINIPTVIKMSLNTCINHNYWLS